jgi:hypothetical protein
MGTLLKTPLELGFVPPSCTNNSPSDSGENQNQDEEPDEESGVESNDIDESPGARNLPPRQESRPKSNTYKVVTAAMKKGQPVSDLKEDLKAGIDHSKMPRNPDNTPPSPPQSRRDRSVLGEELQRTQNIPRPVVLINVTRPEEPDSTRPEVVPQTKEEMEASTNEWIRKARHQKQKRKLQPKSPKGQQNAPETPQTPTPGGSTDQGNKTTRKRITGPVNTVKKKSVKDRLGPFPEKVEFSSKPGSTQWSGTEERVPDKEPEEEPEEGTEPEDPNNMSQQELLREVLRWRNQEKSREPEDDSEGKQ